MPSFLQSLQDGLNDIIHSITTNDHYASHDSSTRRSVNDSGFANSTTALAMVDPSHSNRSSTTNLPGTNGGYRPGLKSQFTHTNDSSSEVPLQDFASGAPPLPSVDVIWEKLEAWMDREYPELADNLEEPATAADLNEIENDLKTHLPLEVRQSYQIHDGQLGLVGETGVVMGLTLLGLDGIMEEFTVWQKVIERIALHHHSLTNIQAKTRQQQLNPNLRPVDFISRQGSVPRGYVQEVYAHSLWIPLCKDHAGNNVAVDLAPGPLGRWGQIIVYGRDFDTKYVVASTWSEFLFNYCEDLEEGNFYVDELDEDFLFQSNGKVMPYLDILKRRAIAVAKAQDKRLGKLPASNNASTSSLGSSKFELPRETLIGQDVKIEDDEHDMEAIARAEAATETNLGESEVVGESESVSVSVPVSESGKVEPESEVAEPVELVAPVEPTEATEPAASELESEPVETIESEPTKSESQQTESEPQQTESEQQPIESETQPTESEPQPTQPEKTDDMKNVSL